jgi:hypothetical protein
MVLSQPGENMNFRKPRPTLWIKVNGDLTEGLLTSDLSLVPEDQRPTKPAPQKRGYKRLFCLERGYWVSLYTNLILE